MFHRWTLVRTEQKIEQRYTSDYDFRTTGFKVTDLYYVCGKVNCHKTKVKRIDGHWTMEELTTTEKRWD